MSTSCWKLFWFNYLFICINIHLFILDFVWGSFVFYNGSSQVWFVVDVLCFSLFKIFIVAMLSVIFRLVLRFVEVLVKYFIFRVKINNGCAVEIESVAIFSVFRIKEYKKQLSYFINLLALISLVATGCCP